MQESDMAGTKSFFPASPPMVSQPWMLQNALFGQSRVENALEIQGISSGAIFKRSEATPILRQESIDSLSWF
jgi:hypothetical protein